MSMRTRREFKRREGFRSARLVVIAAEGRYTENVYFEAMKASLCASNVHVEVLHRDTDNSSPRSVFNQISVFVREYRIKEDDQLWIVVDRDQWKEEMLADVAQHCTQNENLRFCVSNPCFELWLILHLEDVNKYSDEDKKLLIKNRKVSKRGNTWAKQKLRSIMGQYNESNYDTAKLLPNVHLAIERAELMDVNKKDRWSQTIGTRVYLLVKSIMAI